MDSAVTTNPSTSEPKNPIEIQDGQEKCETITVKVPSVPHTKRKKSTKNSNEVTVEDVFKDLGGYSKFQMFATFTIVFLEIPAAMVSLSPILTSTSQVTFYCEDIHGNLTTISHDKLCHSPCNGTITGEKPYVSIVQEWNLYCDRAWIPAMLTSIQMVGSMLGPIATAHIADQYGRKPAFYLICFLMGVSGILSAHAETLFTYGTSRFIAGFAAGGGLVAHMNYLMEYLTPSWRVICGSVSLWPLGEILLGVFGYFMSSWRRLTWITSIPALMLFLTVPLLPESPRWLLCHKKTKEATRVFHSIARWNSRPKPAPETIKKLQLVVCKEESERTDKKGRLSEFKNAFLLKQISILALAWFANALTYYGISFNMKNMSGNRYLNVGLLGAFDFPAELSGIYFSNRFGRKWTFISTLALSSVFLAVLAIVQLSIEGADEKLAVLILSLCLMGRFCNEASWAVMACLSGEIFPTVIRSLSFSICSTFSSIGGIIAPQMAFLGMIWAPGPYIIFCSLSVISCGASVLLEEMKGKPLQDNARAQIQTTTADSSSPVQ